MGAHGDPATVAPPTPGSPAPGSPASLIRPKTIGKGGPRVKGEGLGPDIARITSPHAPWDFAERLVLIKLRQLAFEVDEHGQRVKRTDLPADQRAKVRLVTDPISQQELANACGRSGGRQTERGGSKRTIQRVLPVLVASRAVVPIERWRCSACGTVPVPHACPHGKPPESLERDKNQYEVSPKAIGAWELAERPKSWDLLRKLQGGGSDMAPPPSPHQTALDAACRAKGLDLTDPRFAKALRAAQHADRRHRAIARLEELLPKRRDAYRQDLAALDTACAELGLELLEVAVDSQPAPDSDVLEVVDEEPAADEPTTERSKPQDGADLDAAILAILREYVPLGPLATDHRAHLLGDTARRYGKGLPLVRLGLERFATKIAVGKYGAALALARAFVRNARQTAHGLLDLAACGPPPAAHGVLDQADEELAVLDQADELDPTPEELAALRSGLDAVRALEPTAPTLPPASYDVSPGRVLLDQLEAPPAAGSAPPRRPRR